MTLPNQMPARARWLITGVAGFIGSHLLEALLRSGQEVVGLDDFSTGRRSNLEAVRSLVARQCWAAFTFREGDITRPGDLLKAVEGCEYVLHQAALGSVPLSLEQPARTHAINVTGFVHLLDAARTSGVRRMVYASSSAVYGDRADYPAREENIGVPLSPYALSKRLNELYADTYERCYGVQALGLRYFNVCGARQDPAGAYAAVIPRWIDSLLGGKPVEIFGDGETTRDFCPVQVVVEANLRAALTTWNSELPRVFNVGMGQETSLNRLYQMLRTCVTSHTGRKVEGPPLYRATREGDVRRSVADVTKARRYLGLPAEYSLEGTLSAIVRDSCSENARGSWRSPTAPFS